MAVVPLLGGLVALSVGAELVVRGGTRLARHVGISPLVVGLTVVALGTSMPELAVGIDASRQGFGSLAVANIAGTNTANLLLVLGLTTLAAPLALHSRVLRTDLPVMTGAALLLVAAAWDGHLARWEGVVLLVGAVAYTVLIVRSARAEADDVRAEFAHEFGASDAGPPMRSIAKRLAQTLAGVGVVVVGADWLVGGAEDLARQLGVSDAFIGLTVVAIGTSAPEIFTAAVATLRHDRDIAVGNLFGSSTYNIVAILGTSILSAPGGIEVDRELVRVDIPVMAAVVLVCIPVFWTGRRISRLEGAAMVAAYLAYLGYLVVLRT